MDTVFCPKDNTILTTSTTQNNPPSILDHLAKPSIVKETASEYHCICPICGDDNFKIRKDNGKYQCWGNECSPKEIYKAIVPLEKQGISRSDRTVTKKASKQKALKPAPVPDTPVEFAFLPEDSVIVKGEKKEDSKLGYSTYTKYFYSPTQYVLRIDPEARKTDPTIKKDVKPHHIDASGKDHCNKGDLPWSMYREEECLKYGVDKTVIWDEGERCVECFRYLGFVNGTFQGADWKEKIIYEAALRHKKAGVAKIIYVPDNDEPGRKKAAVVAAACLEAGLTFRCADLKEIYPDLPDGGDIVDVYRYLVKTGMEKDEITASLEKLFQNAPAFVFEELIETDPAELLRRYLLELSEANDPVTKMLLTKNLRKVHGLTTAEINSALRELKSRPEKRKLEPLTLDVLFAEVEKGIKYIIPNLLPENETVLFVADPKVGKSLATYDAAHAIANGSDTFLGEKCKQGRVLIIQTDESRQTAGFRLYKRGFRLTDKENITVLDRFNISKIDLLDDLLSENQFNFVIVDCLIKVVSGKELDEKDPRFSDIVYQLRDLFTKHNSSGILIHHMNKNKDASGVDRVRGSSGIAGAVWGIWFLEHILKPDPRNKGKKIVDPSEPCRIFSIIARDVQGQRLKIELDLENHHWINHGTDQVTEEEAAVNQTTEQRIVDLLKSIAPEPLPAKEIQSRLGIESNIYSPLKRLYDAKSIYKKDAPGGNGRVLYFIPRGDEQLELPEIPPSLPDSERSQTRSQDSITSSLTEKTAVMDEVKPDAIEPDHKDYPVIYPSCEVVIELPEVSSGTGFAPDHKVDHNAITSTSQENLEILTSESEETTMTAAPNVPSSTTPADKPKFEVGEKVILDGSRDQEREIEALRWDEEYNSFLYQFKGGTKGYLERRLEAAPSPTPFIEDMF